MGRQTMSDTRPIPAFDGWSLHALRTHIERLAPTVAGLDDDRADLEADLRAEYDAAVTAFKARSPYGDTSVAADGGQTVTDLVDAETDDDHFLHHVTDAETTFSGRHERTLSTTVEGDRIVHRVDETYAADAHGESMSWRVGLPSSECRYCGGDLATDDGAIDGDYLETATCHDCPYRAERRSVDAPMNDSDYMRPLTYTATIPHDFDDEADVDWDEMKSDLDDTDISDLANVCRALSLRRDIGLIRDAAYDSDAGIQTINCVHCGTTVETPAAEAHAHYGDVCPDCEDVKVWTPDDADLPDDVAAQMDAHKTFNADRIVSLLRDVIHYADYRRTETDDDDDVSIADGITTGRGGKRDAHGMGRGTPGTGLRRPNGAFHGFAHWRTVLSDAAETGLIERTDDRDVADDHKDARWVATDKGYDVFDALARCRTCGERERPYQFFRTYQTHGGRYSKQSTRLTLACADCDQMSHSPQGMTISSSTGSYTHNELDGVEYDD